MSSLDPVARGLAVGAAQSARNNTGRLASWARNYRQMQTPSEIVSALPTITIGTGSATADVQSAIRGATVNISSLSPYSVGNSVKRFTLKGFAGTAPGVPAFNFISSNGGQMSVRFALSGRRFEAISASTFGLGFAMFVDGKLATPEIFPAGFQQNRNHAVLFDFGADASNFYLDGLSVGAGGSGYAVGDVTTLAGGTFTTAATVSVVAVNAGAVTAVKISNEGVYSVAAPSTASQASTTGAGTGLTIITAFGQTHTTNKTRLIELVLDRGAILSGFVIDTDANISPWPVLASAPRVILTGDSITDNYYSKNVGRGFARQTMERLGLMEAGSIFGVAGRGYLTGSRFNTDIAAKIIAPNPDAVIIVLGTNDSAGGITSAALQDQVTTDINTIFAGLPDVKIVVATGWKTSTSLSAAIAAGALASSKPAQVRAVNIEASGIYSTTSYVSQVSTDLVHPHQVGHDGISAALAPMVGAALVELGLT